MPKSKHRNKQLRKPKIVKWKSDGKLLVVPVSPEPLLEIPLPESNSKMEFTYLRGYPPNHPQSKIPRSLKGGQSVYKVTYILSVPGVNTFRNRLDFKKLGKSGESLLQFPVNETIVVEMEDDSNSKIQMWFEGNAKGLLSNVVLRIHCDSFEEAERFAHERVSTMLSYWSFLFDIGIEISAYEILEELTGSLKFSVGLIGRVKPFTNEKPFKVLPEYRRIFAAYREAMNSSNLFYQLLCFFKVTEGIVTLRKQKLKRLLKRSLRKEEEGFEPDEKFPDDIDLLPVEDEVSKIAFQEYLGKGFQEARNDFRESFRNAAAHLGDFNNVLDADRYDDVTKCARAIPVLKFMARKMLENNLNNLSNSIE